MARDVILPPAPIQITEIKENEHLAQGLLAVPNGSWKPLEAAPSPVMLLTRNLSVLPPLTQDQKNEYRDEMGDVWAELISYFILSYPNHLLAWLYRKTQQSKREVKVAGRGDCSKSFGREWEFLNGFRQALNQTLSQKVGPRQFKAETPAHISTF